MLGVSEFKNVIVHKTLIYFFFILIVSNCTGQNKPMQFSVNKLIGKTPPELFGTDFKLQKDAFVAFKKMQEAALKDSIKIKVV